MGYCLHRQRPTLSHAPRDKEGKGAWEREGRRADQRKDKSKQKSENLVQALGWSPFSFGHRVSFPVSKTWSVCL